MRNTNTKPWWEEFDRRVSCIGWNSSARAEVRTPGMQEGLEAYYFLDWDTRKDYCVLVPENDEPKTKQGKNKGLEAGVKFAKDALEIWWQLVAPTVRVIAVDSRKRLLTALPDITHLIGSPSHGLNTSLFHFPWPNYEVATALHDLQVSRRLQLAEIDRLSYYVDLMEDTSRNGERMVAKWLLSEDAKAWQEMHTLKSIPSHPHIAPIYRIIVDEDDYDGSERILGWATKYVEGTDLERNKSQFKMKWLKQLTDTLDYLHLELGIMHLDLQLKNLMIDKATDNLFLIDFEEAQMIDPFSEDASLDLQREFNQVAWSLYEIVTHDTALVEKHVYPPDEEMDEDGNIAWYSNDYYEKERILDANIITNMEEWTARAKLDCDPQALRQHLQDWIRRRKNLPTVVPKIQIHIPRRGSARHPNRSPATEQRIRLHGMVEGSAEIALEKWREVRNNLAVDRVQWERPSYADTYPDRLGKIQVGKATETSTLAKKRPTLDNLEDEPQSKRARVPEATVMNEGDAGSEITDTSTTSMSSTTLSTKTSSTTPSTPPLPTTPNAHITPTMPTTPTIPTTHITHIMPAKRTDDRTAIEESS